MSIKTYTILLLVLLLPLNIFAVDIGQADIPYTISSSGTYEITEDITYSGASPAITVSAANAIIRGKGGVSRAITVSGNDAIYSGNNYAGLEVYDLTIAMNGAYDCIHLTNGTGSKSVTIHDVDMNISLNSGEANGIWFDGGSATLTGSIYNCEITFSGKYSGTNRSSGIVGTGPSSSSNSRFEIHSNVITITGHQTNGIRFYGGNYYIIRNNTVTANSSSDNVKGIQIDGGASFCKIHSNSINIRSNDTTANSYGLRVRFGASSNEIYSNTVNVADSTGSYAAYGISLGGDEGTECNGNLIHNNTITGAGSNIPVSLYNSSGDGTGNDFYCNVITNSGEGTCIYFYPVDSTTPVQNLRFSGDTLTTSGSYAITIPSFCDAGGLLNVSFCGVTVNGSALISEDVNDATPAGGWSISAGPCAYSCSSTTTHSSVSGTASWR